MYYSLTYKPQRYIHSCFRIEDDGPPTKQEVKKAYSNYQSNMKLSSITIKPTMLCNAQCNHCSGRLKRRSSYDLFSGEQLDDMLKQFEQVGVKNVCISGGEPFLYKNLEALVHNLAANNIVTTINTNGTLMNARNTFPLLDAGLMGINVSIDSPLPEVHDQLRNSKGMLQSILKNLDELKARENDFILGIRMILHKQTFRSLPEMLQLAYDIGADALYFDHIENDQEIHQFLMNTSEIMEFKESVVPRTIRILRDDEHRDLNEYELFNCFDDITNSFDNYSRGIYWNKDYPMSYLCEIPGNFCIIETDGTFLQCNAIEYHRELILGNIKVKRLSELLTMQNLNAFRFEEKPICDYCPMNKSHTLLLSERAITKKYDKNSEVWCTAL